MSFAANLSSHERIISAIVRRYGFKEQKEDVIQAAMLKAWKYRHQFVEGTNFKAWIARVTRSVCNDEIKRIKRNKREADLVSAPVVRKEFDLGYSDSLTRAADILPEEQRKVLLLAAIGYKVREISKTLKIPFGTTLSRLYRARQKMIKELRRTECTLH